MTLIGDGVVAVLGDPTLGEAVGGAGVHQTMVEAHANDRRTVGLNLLKLDKDIKLGFGIQEGIITKNQTRMHRCTTDSTN